MKKKKGGEKSKSSEKIKRFRFSKIECIFFFPPSSAVCKWSRKRRWEMDRKIKMDEDSFGHVEKEKIEVY